MIINGKQLYDLKPIFPMENQKLRHEASGTSYGLTECGYDIRLAQDIWLYPGKRFVLGSSYESFEIPTHLMGRILNKSTWARKGIDVSRSTNAEPGWRGFLTLEITYSKLIPIKLPNGCGIAQIIFEEIAEHAQYVGKYQNQSAGPQNAIF